MDKLTPAYVHCRWRWAHRTHTVSSSSCMDQSSTSLPCKLHIRWLGWLRINGGVLQWSTTGHLSLSITSAGLFGLPFWFLCWLYMCVLYGFLIDTSCLRRLVRKLETWWPWTKLSRSFIHDGSASPNGSHTHTGWFKQLHITVPEMHRVDSLEWNTLYIDK